MRNMNQLLSLVKKDLLIEWRQKHTLFGVLLYVGATVFAVYIMNGQPEVKVWNALFWIILLFAAFNTLARSFQREDTGRQLYLYTLVDPRSVVLARALYNGGTMVVLSLLSLVIYTLLLGPDVLENADVPQFLLAVILGGIGFAAVLTLISAIAARSSGVSASP